MEKKAIFSRGVWVNLVPVCYLCALIIFAVLVFKVFVVGIYREDFKDEFVVSGRVLRPQNLLNVHASHPRYVKVFGKRLIGVRGLQPYYLRTKQPDRLIFVTENRRGMVFFHVFEISNGTHLEIKADGAGFGGYIGAKDKSGSDMTDYVESNEKNVMILVKRSAPWTEKYFVDLRQRTTSLQVLNDDK